MSLVDFINQSIRRQTNLIGQPVRNLYGAVAGQSPAVLNQQTAVWLLLAVPAASLPTIAQFYSTYATSAARSMTKLQASDGVVGVAASYFTGIGPTAVLFRGVVDVPGPSVISLGIVTNGPANEFAVYIDGILDSTGNTSLNQSLAVSAGRHLIEIISTATEIYIALPPSLRVYEDLDMLSAPSWNTLSTGYIDNTTGTVGVTLSWYNDTRAGGWIVYRRSLTYLAPITTITALTKAANLFAIEMSGDYTAQLTLGDEVISGNETIGVVQSASYDSTTALTTVMLVLPSGIRGPGIDVLGAGWLNTTAAIGRFAELHRVARVGTVGLQSWIDTHVTINTSYEYQLRAYSMFDAAQVSDPSIIQEITAGDNTAPGMLVFQTGYPQVYNDMVTAKFTTPSDPDYAGVLVQWYDNPVAGTSTNTPTTTTLNDTTKNMVPNLYAGYYILLTANTGAGQVALILSNTTTQFTLDPTTAWDASALPDATTTYDVYQLVNVVTDYGIANTDDQLQFRVPGTGRYYFRTFDHGGNTQTPQEAAGWEYVAANVLTIPVTQMNVTSVTSGGQTSNGALGMSLFSIPQQPALFNETFTGPEGWRLTGTLLTSGTTDASGNTVGKIIKTGAGWTIDAFAGKKIRLVPTSGVFSGFVGFIYANDADEIWFNPDLPMAPNSIVFEVADNFPNTIDPTVLNSTGDRWTTSGTNGIVTRDALWFDGTLNTAYTIYLNSAYSGKTTPFRLGATIGRASTHGSGTNLTYRGSTTNGNRWEYGIVHSSDTVVIPRYRYNSGGAGSWVNMPGMVWNRYASNQLIVEVDGDTHTFRWADAYGHNEQFVGRVTGTAGPLDTRIGWNVRGQSGGDNIDDLNMLDYGKLVRLKYRLLPDNQSLKITQFFGKASSGSTTSLNDTTKNWYTNELAGMRVLITAGPAVAEDRAIVRNTANQLVPDTAFSTAITTASTYIVYEDDFTGTESIQFWGARNSSNAQTLEYHGERVGTPPEPTKRVLVDANQVPEVQLTVLKTATVGTFSEVTCTVLPDDDVKTWSLYAKLGAWPTVDNTPSGPIDIDYVRWQNMPVITSARTLQLDDGTWYFVTVPYDSNGTPGTNTVATLVVSAGAGSTTGLTYVKSNRDGTAHRVKVRWGHTADIETPTTTHSINATVTNMTTGTTWVVTSGVRPWSENGGASAYPLVGWLLDTNWRFGTKGTADYIDLRYDIDLILDATGAIVASYTGYYAFYGYELA